MQRSPSRLAALAVATLLAAVALVVALPGAALAATTASFSRASSWETGYTGAFTVTNTGPGNVSGWRVEFDLPAGTSAGTFWDALMTRTGNHYVFTNRDYNGNLPAGAGTSFGFVAAGTGNPLNCTVNGAPCGGGGPTPTTAPPGPTTTTTRPATTTTTRPPTPPPAGTIRVAPYVDITMERPTLVEVAQATGQRFFTLAFVLGSAQGCVPRWGGTIPLNEPRIVNQIRQLQAMGGDVIVAFGGAAGPYLESLCGSQAALAGAYRQVIDTLGIRHLDIDVEASIPVDMVNAALAQVQRERPGTTVSYTLMVQADDFGLTPQLGVDVLRSAVRNGVRVDVVNPMTMEFPSSRASWGDAVIAAAESTLRQMREIWPGDSDATLNRRLGVTPMIGRNFNGRIFTQAHARQLVAWANTNRIGLLAFWSGGRDNGGCPGGGVSPTCSSISQSQYEFTGILRGFTA